LPASGPKPKLLQFRELIFLFIFNSLRHFPHRKKSFPKLKTKLSVSIVSHAHGAYVEHAASPNQKPNFRVSRLGSNSRFYNRGPMANIANRSPWLVSCPGQESKRIRLKSKAQAYLDSLQQPKARMVQLEESFEVQIKLKDRLGNVVQESGTFDSRAKAEAWAKSEEQRILAFKKANGKFDTAFETMTLEEGLLTLMEEHYKGKASYEENGYRVPHIVSWFGKKKLLKDVTLRDMRDYRKYLTDEGYSASSIRNYFTVITVLYKHAKSEWLFDIPNPTDGVKLEKPDNAITRYWTSGDNEKERLFESINRISPWLLPIVELSLEISFRKGELVPKTLLEKHKDNGLMWEGVDFNNETIRLFKEKNDHTKKNTDVKGRIVPMTKRVKEVLLAVYEAHPTKTGRVFETSGNSVGQAFKNCCDKATPPIKKLTFHSMRKIASYDLSKKLSNPMLLSRVTGHKTIQVLNDRYYEVNVEDLRDMLQELDTDNTRLKGILVLLKLMGHEKASEFIHFVRTAEIQNPTNMIAELKKLSEVNEKLNALPVPVAKK